LFLSLPLTVAGGEVSDSGVQERVLSTLLNEMDGFEALQDVLVMVTQSEIEWTFFC
jgi:SpoVK/Ycf46/Vps4 family AAA+-type ATPase